MKTKISLILTILLTTNLFSKTNVERNFPFSNNETKTSVIIDDEDDVKQKGSLYIGTSSSLIFNNFKIEGDESTSSTHLEAQIGYFVIDNLSILAGISSHQKDQDISLSLRYYMNNFFPEVGYKLYGNKQTSTIFGVGYNYMLNENISVDPTISFENTSKDGNKLSSDFSFKLNLGIYF